MCLAWAAGKVLDSVFCLFTHDLQQILFRDYLGRSLVRFDPELRNLCRIIAPFDFIAGEPAIFIDDEVEFF